MFIFKHICDQCGKWIEAVGERTLVRCSCGQIMTNIGQVESDIKQLRTDANLTQGQFAQELGVSRNYINQLEAGRYPMTSKVLTLLNNWRLNRAISVLNQSQDSNP